VAVVVSVDFVAPPADLAVGAEEAVVDVVPQPDYVVGPELNPDGPPGEVIRVPDVVGALDHAVADVAARSRLGLDGEVVAVGGALEEDVVVAGVVELLHPPRRVQRRPLAVQVHVPPVLVGVEVHAAAAAVPQPHVLLVGEEVHLHALARGRRRGGGRDERSRGLLRRLPFRRQSGAGHFKATAQAPLLCCSGATAGPACGPGHEASNQH
jgi:hypothetical protein